MMNTDKIKSYLYDFKNKNYKKSASSAFHSMAWVDNADYYDEH